MTPGRFPVAAVVYVAVAAVVMVGLIAWDHAFPSRPPDPRDPAVQARATAQSITGERTVRRVELPEPGHVTVQATSKYYNPRATLQDNRAYLATEGRLIVQLILRDMPDITVARVELYAGRRRVAIVEGRSSQAYDQYAVGYEGALVR